RDDVLELVLIERLAGCELPHRGAVLAAQRPRRHQDRGAGGGQLTIDATCTLKLSSPPSSRARRTIARHAASGGWAVTSSTISGSRTGTWIPSLHCTMTSPACRSIVRTSMPTISSRPRLRVSMLRFGCVRTSSGARRPYCTCSHTHVWSLV